MRTITLALVLFGFIGSALGSEHWEIESVATPAGDRIACANLCRGAGDDLFLVWIESRGPAASRPGSPTHALRFAAWTADGWGPAQLVADGRDWFVNWADLPTVCSLSDGTLAAQWLRKSGTDTYAYDIFVSLSHDRGQSWDPAFKLHNDTTQTEHGFVSMRPADDGFLVVWLDGRLTGGHGGHGHGHGPMTLRSAIVSADGTISARTELDESVCSCCPTDAVVTADGDAFVVYRDREQDERRDMSVLQRKQGTWLPAREVRRDGWIINGCPVNGPALAAGTSTLHSAWFTGAGGEAAVYTSQASLTDAQFAPAQRVDAGRPAGRTDVTVCPSGRSFVSWMESADQQLDIHLREIAVDGTPGASQVIAHTASNRSSGIPRIECIGDRILAMWLQPGERAPLRTAIIMVAPGS